MFAEDAFLETAQNDLFEMVRGHHPKQADEPFPWDSYIAKSQMQKAIRRGDGRVAWTAARVLLTSNERGFWKRLAIIALEDIGCANIALVAQVLLVEKHRSLRNQLGGPTLVGAALVDAMCMSPKDRSTDDLIDALGAPKYDCLKAEIAELSPEPLFELAVSTSAPVQHRALAALRLSSGNDSLADALPKDHRWCRLLHMLPEDIAPPSFKITAMLGLERTRSIMAPLLAILSRDVPTKFRTVGEAFPASEELNGLPSWVLDGHTRLGLHAFRLYVKQSDRMSRFLKLWATGEVSQSKTVAGLVFRTESAQLANKMDWPVGQQLKQEACANRPGLPPGAAAEGLSIVRQEFDLVNACRAQAVRVYLR